MMTSVSMMKDTCVTCVPQMVSCHGNDVGSSFSTVDTHELLRDMEYNDNDMSHLQVTESGKGLRVHTQQPHLVSLGGGRLSTAVTLLPLPPGKSTVGTTAAPYPQDVVISGAGVDARHCYIINTGGAVVLYPLTGACAVDGLLIHQPTRLTQGCMLCLGRSNYFRFNHPEEARQLKDRLALTEARIAAPSAGLLPGADHVTDYQRQYPQCNASVTPLTEPPRVAPSNKCDPRYNTPPGERYQQSTPPSRQPNTVSGPNSRHPQQRDRYRDSLEGSDFLNKVTRFEFLTHQTSPSAVTPRTHYSTTQPSSSLDQEIPASPSDPSEDTGFYDNHTPTGFHGNRSGSWGNRQPKQQQEEHVSSRFQQEDKPKHISHPPQVTRCEQPSIVHSDTSQPNGYAVKPADTGVKLVRKIPESFNADLHSSSDEGFYDNIQRLRSITEEAGCATQALVSPSRGHKITGVRPRLPVIHQITKPDRQKGVAEKAAEDRLNALLSRKPVSVTDQAESPKRDNLVSGVPTTTTASPSLSASSRESRSSTSTNSSGRPKVTFAATPEPIVAQKKAHVSLSKGPVEEKSSSPISNRKEPRVKIFQIGKKSRGKSDSGKSSENSEVKTVASNAVTHRSNSQEFAKLESNSSAEGQSKGTDCSKEGGKSEKPEKSEKKSFFQVRRSPSPSFFTRGLLRGSKDKKKDKKEKADKKDKENKEKEEKDKSKPLAKSQVNSGVVSSESDSESRSSGSRSGSSSSDCAKAGGKVIQKESATDEKQLSNTTVLVYAVVQKVVTSRSPSPPAPDTDLPPPESPPPIPAKRTPSPPSPSPSASTSSGPPLPVSKAKSLEQSSEEHILEIVEDPLSLRIPAPPPHRGDVPDGEEHYYDQVLEDSYEYVDIADKDNLKREITCSDSDSGSEEDFYNPWRVNLKENLKQPDLTDYKGEKVFKKDTTVTSVVVPGFENAKVGRSPRNSLERSSLTKDKEAKTRQSRSRSNSRERPATGTLERAKRDPRPDSGPRSATGTLERAKRDSRPESGPTEKGETVDLTVAPPKLPPRAPLKDRRNSNGAAPVNGTKSEGKPPTGKAPPVDPPLCTKRKGFVLVSECSNSSDSISSSSTEERSGEVKGTRVEKGDKTEIKQQQKCESKIDQITESKIRNDSELSITERNTETQSKPLTTFDVDQIAESKAVLSDERFESKTEHESPKQGKPKVAPKTPPKPTFHVDSDEVIPESINQVKTVSVCLSRSDTRSYNSSCERKSELKKESESEFLSRILVPVKPPRKLPSQPPELPATGPPELPVCGPPSELLSGLPSDLLGELPSDPNRISPGSASETSDETSVVSTGKTGKYKCPTFGGTTQVKASTSDKLKDSGTLGSITPSKELCNKNSDKVPKEKKDKSVKFCDVPTQILPKVYVKVTRKESSHAASDSKNNNMSSGSQSTPPKFGVKVMPDVGTMATMNGGVNVDILNGNQSPSGDIMRDDPFVNDNGEDSDVNTPNYDTLSLDDLDLDDLTGSQQDLKRLAVSMRSERKKEQEMAKLERQRLEDILNMCAEYEKELETERGGNRSSRHSDHGSLGSPGVTRDLRNSMTKIKTNGSLTKLASPSQTHKDLDYKWRRNSSSSNSEEEGSENGTIKRRPSFETNGMVQGSLTSPNYTSDIPGESSEDKLLLKVGIPKMSDSDTESGFVFTFPSNHSNSDHGYHNTLTTPGGNVSSTHTTPSGHVQNHKDEEADPRLQRLKASRRDVIQHLSRLKQRISDTEELQGEAVRELELEQALLQGERQTELSQLQTDQRHLADLKQRQGVMLDAATRERHLEQEKLERARQRVQDLEHRCQASEQLLAHSTSEGEEAPLRQRLARDREELEQQQKVYDDLEFQQLEVEAHYEEQCEHVQQELVAEQDAVLSTYREREERLQQIDSQQQEMVTSVRNEIETMEMDRQQLIGQFRQEKSRLANLEQEINSLTQHGEVSADKVSPMSCAAQREYLELIHAEGACVTPPSHRRHMQRTLRDADPTTNAAGIPQRAPCDDRVVRDAACKSGGSVESEVSSISSSETPSDKETSLSSGEDHLEKVVEMERMLGQPHHDQLKLAEGQVSVWREAAECYQMNLSSRYKGGVRAGELTALQSERRRRMELEQQLEEEVARRDQLVEQQIRRRDQQRTQSRPLTRYMPQADREIDLKQFVESAGHNLDDCTNIQVTMATCRGFLHKMGSKFKTWNKRWFVFDRSKRTLLYYSDKSENKPRGGIYFQAIEDVYVDHLRTVKSPNSKLTFCVKTFDRTYFLVAPSAEEMRVWIDVIFTGAEGYQEFE